MSSVKVVGSSACSASGLHKNDIFKACYLGESAVIVDTGLAPFSQSAWTILNVDYFKPVDDLTSRCSTLSSYTLKKALAESNWSADELKDCGFIFSTTTSQIDQWQNSLPFFKAKNLSFDEITKAAKYQSLGITLVELQNEFQIQGPVSVLASSCSASLQAICLAQLWIKSGKVKRCIVGATEILSDLTVNGFNSMRLLSKRVSQPFDKNRSGINLGEASGFLCLEADDVSSREAQGYLTGAGLSTDAYHPTSPMPDGEGSVEAMQMALTEAKLNPSDIDWVYAHGTGSTANDLAETKAMKTVFKNSNPAITSTKSIHGHTLGACGALEVILSLISLEKNLILHTHNTFEIDPEINLDIVLKPREQKISHILKNSLGFGGINASVIISKSIGTKQRVSI